MYVKIKSEVSPEYLRQATITDTYKLQLQRLDVCPYFAVKTEEQKTHSANTFKEIESITTLQ